MPVGQRFEHRADGARLIGPSDDGAIHFQRARIDAQLAALDVQRQLVAAVETLHLTRRRLHVVPEIRGVTVAVIDQRSLAVLRRQCVGIQFCLLATDFGILQRALGLDHSERLAVGGPQHVIRLAAAAWRTDQIAQRHLDADRVRAERPACLGQQHVDQLAPRLGFVVVVRVGHRNRRRLGLRQFGAALRQFGVERRQRLLALGECCCLCGNGLLALVEQRRFLGQFGSKFLFLLLQLLASRHCRFLRGGGGIHQHRHARVLPVGHDLLGITGPRIGARKPAQNVKQLVRQPHRIHPRHRLLRMYRLVALVLDELHLVEHLRRHEAGEFALVEQAVELVVGRHAQAVVVLVQPQHRLLQRMAGAHHRRARIDAHQPLDADGVIVQRAEFRKEKREVTHAAGLSVKECTERTACGVGRVWRRARAGRSGLARAFVVKNRLRQTLAGSAMIAPK